MNNLKPGDKITVPFWGREYGATVSRIGRARTSSTLVWVRFDGETRERWFHPSSIKAA